ncbi:unnamed protein product [Protopolystoma xenopodis]|uniref:Uncharacterized protein n=1 Tax=Protopolystoma xenopodis TaxID=117903 RepID=A0A3S5BVX7_9PLAT|nr:unnamed protein product [Protopolystoma xenopodis]
MSRYFRFHTIPSDPSILSSTLFFLLPSELRLSDYLEHWNRTPYMDNLLKHLGSFPDPTPPPGGIFCK